MFEFMFSQMSEAKSKSGNKCKSLRIMTIVDRDWRRPEIGDGRINLRTLVKNSKNQRQKLSAFPNIRI